MSAENAKEKRKISPIWIIPGIAVLAFAFLSMQPQPAPPATVEQPSAPAGVSMPSSAPNSLATAPAPAVSPSPTVPSQPATEKISGRDPFFPVKVKAQPKPLITQRAPETTLPFPLPPPVLKEERGPEPVWKGTIGTKNDRVVMIDYKERPYILRLGDLLPGTEYRVAEINPDYILLSSPAKQLRLTRKTGLMEVDNVKTTQL